MLNQFSRTQLLYGEARMKILSSSRVAVFGVGGVGGYVVEALARSGIGALDLIDNDKVCLTNINRQILATRKTVGRYKVDVAKERILEINPDCTVRTYRTFFLPQTQDQFDFQAYDYVVDAIDTVAGKLTIVEEAKKASVPVISSMGAGNKVDPAAFMVADLYETSVCPLAKVMRRECKKRGIDSLKVVYSREKPLRPDEALSAACRQENSMENPGEMSLRPDEALSAACRQESSMENPGEISLRPDEADRQERDAEEREAGGGSRRRSVPGSTAFVPSVVGLIIAGEIINDLTGIMKT